jgi:hypothetical protein
MFCKIALTLTLISMVTPTFAAERTIGQATAEIFALIDQSDEMVVYSEGFKREFVIYRSSNRKDFDELKSAITLKENGGPFVCACVDGPEISLLKDGQEIATLWNHEGKAIGSSVWKGDWDSGDPNRWLSWFDARQITSAREFFNRMQIERRKAIQDEKRWLNAMPSSLKPLWENARRQYNPPLSFPDLRPLDIALAQQYPDVHVRIRALMFWFGSGAGPWSGFPGYEEIAAKLLREYSTPELIRAAEEKPLNEQEIEGAARILGSWKPVPDPTPIPVQLRQTLLEHCLASFDEDKLGRARKAFSPDK